MMLRVALNKIYPDYETYRGQVGYARSEYKLSKPGIPFLDSWIRDTAIREIESAITSEAAIPLQVIILYEDRRSYWRIEVRQWVYQAGWATQVVETGAIIMLMLKILAIIGIAFVLWALSTVIHETTSLLWGPGGANGGGMFTGLIPFAILIFGGAVFITAVTKFSAKEK